MQNFNFDFGDPIFDIFDQRCLFRIYTDENVYTPHPNSIKIQSSNSKIEIKADTFAYAGLQESKSGFFHATLIQKNGEIFCSINASMDERIKGSTIRLLNVPKGNLPEKYFKFEKASLIENQKSWIQHYPNPLFFPAAVIQLSDHQYFYAISDDTQIREKVFEIGISNGDWYLDLHHSEDAKAWSKHHISPPWRIGTSSDPQKIFGPRIKIMKEHWGLDTWENRQDVPEWSKKIGLVVNLHAMHWTGYIYNRYEDQLNALKYLSEQLEGKHILAYLPAWDGRYNYNWPNYKVNERLGGEEAFKKLIDGGHQLGIHIIPQYGAVSANKKYLPASLHDCASRDSYGNTYVKSIDWDGDRISDAYRINANIGHPAFRQFLLDLIIENNHRYGFDGTFMDITQVFHNDPGHHITEGHVEFTNTLKETFDDHLLFAEEIYDGLMGAYPLNHSYAGNLGEFSSVFEEYNRVTYHLIHPDPAGHTGVYESGFHAPVNLDPNLDIIPCLSITNGTIQKYPEEVKKVIHTSKAYLERKNIS